MPDLDARYGRVGPSIKGKAGPRRVFEPDDLVGVQRSAGYADQFVVVHVASICVPGGLFRRPGIDDAMDLEEALTVASVR